MVRNTKKHKHNDNEVEMERFNKIKPKTHFSQHSDLQWSKTHKKRNNLKQQSLICPALFYNNLQCKKDKKTKTKFLIHDFAILRLLLVILVGPLCK